MPHNRLVLEGVQRFYDARGRVLPVVGDCEHRLLDREAVVRVAFRAVAQVAIFVVTKAYRAD